MTANETPQDRVLRYRLDPARDRLDGIAMPMALSIITNYAYGDGSHHIPQVLGRYIYEKLQDQIEEAAVDLRDGNDNLERRLGEFKETIHTAISAAKAEAARTASLIEDLTSALFTVSDKAWAVSETPPATTPYFDDDAQD
jgi:hypothetical protein